jgi:tartrate dehydratase beta subunit/fumarate hydratase class I family protein
MFHFNKLPTFGAIWKLHVEQVAAIVAALCVVWDEQHDEIECDT